MFNTLHCLTCFGLTSSFNRLPNITKGNYFTKFHRIRQCKEQHKLISFNNIEKPLGDSQTELGQTMQNNFMFVGCILLRSVHVRTFQTCTRNRLRVYVWKILTNAKQCKVISNYKLIMADGITVYWMETVSTTNVHHSQQENTNVST
jgi:hypothetical protein